MFQANVSVEELARVCAVDRKPVERWISPGRPPHPRSRRAAAGLLGVTVGDLWPELCETVALRSTDNAIMSSYPDRASVPRSVWLRLLEQAAETIDVLVFSGTFLAQTAARSDRRSGRPSRTSHRSPSPLVARSASTTPRSTRASSATTTSRS